jgi:hypothetical protein
MATFGSETYRADGSVAMTGSNKAGLFIEVLSIPPSSVNGSRVYNGNNGTPANIPAGAMFVLNAGTVGTGAHEFTISDDGLGHAQINWQQYNNGYAPTATSRFLIFAKRVNRADAFGMDVLNDTDDALVDISYPVPQYAGTIQPAARANRRYDCADGVTEANEYDFVVNLRPTTNRIVMVNLPDGGTNGVWYACPSFIPAGSGTVTLVLTIIRPYGVAYQVPSLHIFSVDGPVVGGGTFGIQYFKPDGSLVYDSSAENVSIKDLALVDYGNDVVLTMALPAKAGITIPYFFRYQAVAYDAMNPNSTGYTREYLSVAQRRGSNVEFRLMWTKSKTYTNSIGALSQEGAQHGFTLAVDITQLTPTTINGIPA